LADTFYHPPQNGDPKPVRVLYAKPDHTEAVFHVLPLGMRWGRDAWGCGPCWIVDVRDVKDGDEFTLLLSGVREWREE
jgi:hypothetical protein